MNGRIPLRIIATHLQSLPALSGVTVGTSFEHDFISRFPTTYPAVWLIGQNCNRMDEGHGYSSRMRQRMRAEIFIRIVVARFTEGVIDAESALTTLQNAVSAGMFGWMPADDYVEEPFVWVRSKDGPLVESVVVSDVAFSGVVMFNA